MPALSYDSILQQERVLLDEAAKKLAVFDKEAEGDELGEVVYASLVSALDAANKDYDGLVQTWQHIQQASAQGQVAINALPESMADRAPFFQGSGPTAVALNNIIMALCLYTKRPSDVWRAEIRRQGDALLARLHQSLTQGMPAEQVAHMSQIYTSAFCWFELAWFDSDGAAAGQAPQKSIFSQLFSLEGALLVAGVGVAGYFGGRYAVPFVADKVGGMLGLGGRTKNKQLKEAEIIEEDEEDEDTEDLDNDDDEEDEEEEEVTFKVADIPPLQLEAGL